MLKHKKPFYYPEFRLKHSSVYRYRDDYYRFLKKGFVFSLFFDVSTPGQIGFQDPGTLFFMYLVDVHDDIFFYLIVVVIFVFEILRAIYSEFTVFNFKGVLLKRVFKSQ
jgi:hypothetical protein